jgi:hypothetical protein
MVHTHRTELVRKPIGGFIHVRFVGGVMGNGWNAQEFDQFVLKAIMVFFEIGQGRRIGHGFSPQGIFDSSIPVCSNTMNQQESPRHFDEGFLITDY